MRSPAVLNVTPYQPPCSASLRAEGWAPRASRVQAGFTTVELLVVMAIAAILLVIAVPTLQNTIQSNRVNTEANAYLRDLRYAQAEAIKEGLSVTICPSTDGASCKHSTTTWQNGWIVFADTNGNQTVDTGEPILRIQKPWTAGDTFVSSNSVSAVTYGRDGFTINLFPAGTAVNSTVTFTLHASPAQSFSTQCVQLNIAGSQNLVAAGAGGCS